jgi:hypothetical protein
MHRVMHRWSRNAASLRRLRRLRVLSQRLSRRFAIRTWESAASRRGVAATIASRRRIAVEFAAWRRQVSRRERSMTAHEAGRITATCHAARRAMERLRANAASAGLRAATEQSVRLLTLRRALARGRVGAMDMATSASNATHLTRKADKIVSERSARLRLISLWRWRAHSAATGALSPPSSTALRARRCRRILSDAARTWKTRSADIVYSKDLAARGIAVRLRVVLICWRRMAAAASAASAVRRVEHLLYSRRSANRGLLMLKGWAVHHGTLVSTSAVVEDRWRRHLQRVAVRCLLRHTVSRLLQYRSLHKPALDHWLRTSLRRSMLLLRNMGLAQRLLRLACAEGEARTRRAALRLWHAWSRNQIRGQAALVRAVHLWQRFGATRGFHSLRRARRDVSALGWQSRSQLQFAAAKAASTLFVPPPPPAMSASSPVLGPRQEVDAPVPVTLHDVAALSEQWHPLEDSSQTEPKSAPSGVARWLATHGSDSDMSWQPPKVWSATEGDVIWSSTDGAGSVFSDVDIFAQANATDAARPIDEDAAPKRLPHSPLAAPTTLRPHWVARAVARVAGQPQQPPLTRAKYGGQVGHTTAPAKSGARATIGDMQEHERADAPIDSAPQVQQVSIANTSPGRLHTEAGDYDAVVYTSQDGFDKGVPISSDSIGVEGSSALEHGDSADQKSLEKPTRYLQLKHRDGQDITARHSEESVDEQCTPPPAQGGTPVVRRSREGVFVPVITSLAPHTGRSSARRSLTYHTGLR